MQLGSPNFDIVLETRLFWGQKVKVTRHKKHCRRWSWCCCEFLVSTVISDVAVLRILWAVVKVSGVKGAQPPCFGLRPLPLLQFEPYLLNAWPGLLQIKAKAFSTIKSQTVIIPKHVVVSG